MGALDPDALAIASAPPMLRPRLKRYGWLAYERVSAAVVWRLERREGIETVGVGRRDPAEPDAEGRVPHRASGWRTLQRALPAQSVSAQDVFVDLGAGMGRVVYQAAKDYSFRRVIGVELSRELSDIAQRNIERNRERLACRDVEIVTADVRAYEIPDDATVIYLYNPFVGDLFAAALARLYASHDRRPRRIRLIYVNPVEHAQIVASGRAQLVARRPPLWRPTAGWRKADTVHEYQLGMPV